MVLCTFIHTLYILIAIWLIPGAGGIYPTEIRKIVSSLSGNLLNDFRYYVSKNLSIKPPLFNLDYLCFYYYLLARNCTVCRVFCHDYSSSGLSHAFRSVVEKKKNVIHQPRSVRIGNTIPSVLSTQVPWVSKTSGTVFPIRTSRLLNNLYLFFYWSRLEKRSSCYGGS